jgi:hypothetical protein
LISSSRGQDLLGLSQGPSFLGSGEEEKEMGGMWMGELQGRNSYDLSPSPLFLLFHFFLTLFFFYLFCFSLFPFTSIILS